MTSVLGNSFWLLAGGSFCFSHSSLSSWFNHPSPLSTLSTSILPRSCAASIISRISIKKALWEELQTKNLIRDKGRDDLISAVAQHQIKIANAE